MILTWFAWRRVGVKAWAAYSREPDLDNGLAYYPLVPISHAVFSIAVGLHVSSRAIAAADITSVMASVVMLVTLKAAQVILKPLQ